jgi:hypothetical protein
MTDHDNAWHPPHRTFSFPRIAIVVVLVIAFIGLLLLLMNRSSRTAWEKYKQELAARGESLNWKDYLPPPPPPDDENFAATPLLKAVGVRGKVDPAVWARFQGLGLEGQLGKFGDWMNGRRAELKSIQVYVRGNANFALPQPLGAPATDVLAALESVEDDLNELRQAARRPSAKLHLNYSDPSSSDIPNFVALLELSQLLSLRASAELALARPDDAFADLLIIHRLGDTVSSEPNLVSAMICVAIRGLELQAFWEGWLDGRWSEVQLAEFQRLFDEVNLPAIVDRALRAERAGITTFVERSDNRTLATSLAFTSGGLPTWKNRLAEFAVRFSPHGWRYKNLLNYNQLMDRTYFGQWDETNHCVSPAKVQRASMELQSELSSSNPLRLPFNYLASVGIPNFSRAFEVAVRNQTALNQAALVCALERYRHAHGQYPDSLDQLVPDFAQKLPHDLIGGQPLKYRRTAEAKFLLYSIGWNEKDDNGDPDKQKDDWVWPAVGNE